MTPRKILLLTTSLAHGGAEVVVTQLALALRSSGCDVCVVSMMEPTAFVEELKTGGAPVVSLNMKPGRPNLGGVLRFLRLLRQYRPHLIHAHMYHAAILGRLARVLTRTPAVCTIHSEVECLHGETSAKLREFIYRITDAASSRTTAVSERVRQRYVQKRIVPSLRIETIDNGVDIRRFHRCAERRVRARTALGWDNAFVWLAVGRLEHPKDYPNLIEAFKRIHKRFPSSRLAIAGEGRLRSQIEQCVERAGLQESVSLLGFCSDVVALMNACDAFAMSSAWEGGPLALLEASACELPLVSTDVGVASQIVLPDKTGFLVPPRDANALAQAMEQLMGRGSEARRQMGQQARRHVVDHFSLASVHGRYRQLYDEVLADAL